jgi:hypothetical protein
MYLDSLILPSIEYFLSSTGLLIFCENPAAEKFIKSDGSLSTESLFINLKDGLYTLHLTEFVLFLPDGVPGLVSLPVVPVPFFFFLLGIGKRLLPSSAASLIGGVLSYLSS